MRRTLVVLLICAGAAPAHAQSLSSNRCGRVPATRQLFTGTVDALTHLASRESVTLLAVGGAAALAGHGADRDVTSRFARDGALRDTFRPGAILGSAPFEMGAALVTYSLGREMNRPCVASLGADLLQAQAVGQLLTVGIKQAAQRPRPEGAGRSFPSGHTATAFASATVLQQHFGWKVGLPAYAVASYVGASRVQMKRHYLSDVAFGAAIGIVAGRSVTLANHRFVLGPMVADHGGGIAFTLAPHK
jgi:membrane-associated phospholipid phosphatase